MMKCPYCNKTLSPLIFGGGLTCKNEKCKKSMGMVGTQPMWEKLSQLVKIREAGEKYRNKHKVEIAARVREYYRKRKKEQKNDI